MPRTIDDIAGMIGLKREPRRAALVILVAGAVLGTGLLLWWRQGHVAGPPATIVLGVDFSDTFSSPVLIAESQGYFRDEGLDVRIVEYPSGRTALADMVRKKDLDVVTVAQTPVMYNSFASDTYAIIAGMASSYEAGCRLLARKDRGIAVARDLRGRKIGTPVGSTGHFFLNLFLVYNGLSLAEVDVVDIDAPELPRAIAEGRVDAISIWQPQSHIALEKLGDRAVILPSKGVYRVDFYLVADRGFLGGNAGALRGLLRAVRRAEDFIANDREQAIEIVSGRMKTDRQVVSAIWEQYQFKIFLDQAIVTDLEAEGRWAIENKYASAAVPPDYREFVDPAILESIDPTAVNLIR